MLAVYYYFPLTLLPAAAPISAAPLLWRALKSAAIYARHDAVSRRHRRYKRQVALRRRH